MRVRALMICACVLVLGAMAGAAIFAGSGRAHPAEQIAPLDLSPGSFSLGVQDDQLPVAEPRRITWGMDRLDVATDVTRLDLIWKFVEPDAGRYRLAAYDRMFEALQDRGIGVILDVHTPAEWAMDERGVDIEAYGAMLRRVLCRPAARRVIVALEPWNEPNIAFFLTPQWRRGADGTWQPVSPRIYAALVRAAAEARDACMSDVPLMGPALAATGSAAPRGGVGVLDFYAELPKDLPLDVISQHLYAAGSPEDSRAMPSYRRLDDVLDAADAALGRPLPLVISETGFLTAKTPYHSTVVTPREQAERLRESVQIARAHPRVRGLIYFNLEDNPNWPAGLHRLRGPAKPAWGVFLELAGRTGDAR